MHDATGAWLGWGLGDNDPEVQKLKAYMRRMFRSYAGNLAGTPIYDGQMVLAVEEMQRRYGLPVTGIINYATKLKMGYVKPAPVIKPIFVSVEGHSSNMFFGPVADTATQLEGEKLCHHQPVFYNNGAIPFDNASGVAELNRLFSLTELDGAWGQKIPFPIGTPIVLGGFSQGMIVLYDWLAQYNGPRKKDIRCFLFYGNPCRATNSGGSDGTHGLDPLKRFDLPGCVPQPANAFEVWRNGDIFAQNTDDLKGQLKASIYQAVARGDFVSNPYGLVSELLAQMPQVVGQNYFELLTFGIAVFQAIVGGIVFLADNPNPHYSPYDIEPGKAFVRKFLS